MATIASGQTTFNYNQLRQLWIQAGGNKTWSYVMAAIAMAESGGHAKAHHLDSDGSVDWGLWQINSVHFRGNVNATTMQNPIANAKEAVAVFKSSGPGAWSTYKSGAYKNYLPKNQSAPQGAPQGQYAGLVNPVPQGTFERVDQGADYGIVTPTKAVAAGVIAYIDPNFYRGTPAVYEKLDKPITVDGRSYPGVYYSETGSLVKKGQRVKAGQDVTKAGDVEVGFAKIIGGAWLPAAHGGYTEGVPTQAGKDFEQLIVAIGAQSPGTISAGGGSVPNAVKSAASGVTGAISGAFSGIESLLLQGFFILIGVVLITVGLGIVAFTVLGKVGAPLPGAVGMIQSQQRIRQSGARIEESNRASTVRESQAGQRIQGQTASRELSRERLQVQKQNVGRREERYVVKDKPNQVVRKKAGNPAAGVPRRDRG